MATLLLFHTVSIHGTIDVGFNRKLDEWPNVQTVLSIKNGTTISIVYVSLKRKDISIYPVSNLSQLYT